MSIEAMEARIAELEMRVAFQEDTIHRLNEALVQQHHGQERMQRALERLDATIARMQASSHGDPTPEPPPPHY
jgi:SlyX protein